MAETDYEQMIALYEQNKLQEEYNTNLAAMRHLVTACAAFAGYIPNKIARDEQFAAAEHDDLENRRQFVKATRKKLEKTGHLTKKNKSAYEEEKAFVRDTDRRIAEDIYFKEHAASLVRGGKVQIPPLPGREDSSPSFYEFTEQDKKNLEKAINTILNHNKYAGVDKSPDISEQMSAYAEQDEMLYRYDPVKSMDIITSQLNDLSMLFNRVRRYDGNDKKSITDALETVSKAGRRLMMARASLNGIQYNAYLEGQKKKDAELIYDQQEALDFPTCKEKIAAGFKTASEYMCGRVAAVYGKIKDGMQNASHGADKESEPVLVSKVKLAFKPNNRGNGR